jgi:hypothetical protein
MSGAEPLRGLLPQHECRLRAEAARDRQHLLLAVGEEAVA